MDLIINKEDEQSMEPSYLSKLYVYKLFILKEKRSEVIIIFSEKNIILLSLTFLCNQRENMIQTDFLNKQIQVNRFIKRYNFNLIFAYLQS